MPSQKKSFVEEKDAETKEAPKDISPETDYGFDVAEVKRMDFAEKAAFCAAQAKNIEDDFEEAKRSAGRDG